MIDGRSKLITYLQSNITEWLNGEHELPFNKPMVKVERKCRDCKKVAKCELQSWRQKHKIKGCTQWEEASE